jgi:hypothetical protein
MLFFASTNRRIIYNNSSRKIVVINKIHRNSHISSTKCFCVGDRFYSEKVNNNTNPNEIINDISYKC